MENSTEVIRLACFFLFIRFDVIVSPRSHFFAPHSPFPLMKVTDSAISTKTSESDHEDSQMTLASSPPSSPRKYAIHKFRDLVAHHLLHIHLDRDDMETRHRQHLSNRGHKDVLYASIVDACSMYELFIQEICKENNMKVRSSMSNPVEALSLIVSSNRILVKVPSVREKFAKDGPDGKKLAFDLTSLSSSYEPLTWLDWHLLVYGARCVFGHGSADATLGEKGALGRSRRERLRSKLEMLAGTSRDKGRAFGEAMLCFLNAVEHPRLSNKCYSTHSSFVQDVHLPEGVSGHCNLCHELTSTFSLEPDVVSEDKLKETLVRLVTVAELWYPRLIYQLALKLCSAAKIKYPTNYPGYAHPDTLPLGTELTPEDKWSNLREQMLELTERGIQMG